MRDVNALVQIAVERHATSVDPYTFNLALAALLVFTVPISDSLRRVVIAAAPDAVAAAAGSPRNLARLLATLAQWRLVPSDALRACAADAITATAPRMDAYASSLALRAALDLGLTLEGPTQAALVQALKRTAAQAPASGLVTNVTWLAELGVQLESDVRAALATAMRLHAAALSPTGLHRAVAALLALGVPLRGAALDATLAAVPPALKMCSRTRDSFCAAELLCALAELEAELTPHVRAAAALAAGAMSAEAREAQNVRNALQQLGVATGAHAGWRAGEAEAQESAGDAAEGEGDRDGLSRDADDAAWRVTLADAGGGVAAGAGRRSWGPPRDKTRTAQPGG